MAWSEEERFQIQKVFDLIDQASSDFERLMEAKDAPELLDKLERFRLPELRRILLARAHPRSRSVVARADATL